MSSNYTFCGYDFQDANSMAGKSTEGINLNSVTVQYNLQNNPTLCEMIYKGIVPSRYGNGPTIEDGGTATIDQLPTVVEYDEKGDVVNMNPTELATITGQQIPTVQFTGALSPMYHDNSQPIPNGAPMMQFGSFTPGLSMQQNMVSGFMPINYTHGIPYNYNPINPTAPIVNMSQSMQEWNDYQRTKGFRAPIPSDTDFPEAGLLSGFHRGFDPMKCTAPGQDEFYDVSAGGRIGIAQFIHQQNLARAAMTWGWVPGQVIERREQMMFPGINEDHNDPKPSSDAVTGANGMHQRRLMGGAMPSMMASNLPIFNMVATNPFMAGISTIGGYAMNQPQQNLPTPYMQARYNYAIHNGFQSVQEMDNNDFRIIKRCSRAANNHMTDEEFEDYFYNNWCRRFLDIYEYRERMEKEDAARSSTRQPIDKIVCTLRKGDKILAGVDCNDPNQYRTHCENVRRCAASHKSDAEYRQMEYTERYTRYLKDQKISYLHSQAPERRYDDKPMLEFMRHGWVESFFYHLNQQEIIDRADPNKRLRAAKIDQTAFMKRCLENGMGLSAANSRIKAENEMFYVGKPFPDDQIGNKPRGSYGTKANGESLDLNVYPSFGYATYIPDPENPNIAIPFPRQFISDLYDGYTKYCVAINAKSSKKIVPMSYEEFSQKTGVRICDDKEYLEKYKGLEGTDKYTEFAQRGLSKYMENPIWADKATTAEQDEYERTHPHDDIPFEELIRDLDEDPIGSG